MQRQLKFRVWDTKNKQFLSQSSEYYHIGDVTGIPYTLNEILNKLDRFVVQQFTGLKDSKGVEIYEGDIIRGKFHDTGYHGHLETLNSEVVWIERYASFNIGIEEWRYSGEPVTIIGNIFENSELLKDEN